MAKSMLSAVLGVLMFCDLAHAQAGSLERVPATGTDVARELGIVMRKFKVRFDKPMHCMVTLKIKHIGSMNPLLPRPIGAWRAGVRKAIPCYGIGQVGA